MIYMNFNQGKYQIVHLGQGNSGSVYRPGNEGLGSSFVERAPQGSVPAPNLTVQEGFGQSSLTCGVSLGVSCAGPLVGLDDPDWSLPAQHILWLYDFQEDG